MRIVTRYLTGAFLATFIVALAVLTFVLAVAIIFRITDLLARGVPWKPVLQVFLWAMPSVLAFAIPAAALTSALLVFGRLSADGEITAMKSCGISMWRVARGPVLCASLLLALCLLINNEISPRSHYARRSAVARLGVLSPAELLEEGRFTHEFPGLTIYVGQKKGTRIKNIRIYDLRDPQAPREIRAQSGRVRADPTGRTLLLDLADVRVDPFYPDRPGPGFCSEWTIRIEDALRRGVYRKKAKDMTFRELLDGVRNVTARFSYLSGPDLAQKRMSLAVELNTRISLSAACLAFVVLAVPLGVKSHRRESTIGLAMSLGVAFAYYIFMIVAQSLTKHPDVRPDLIVWVPVVLSLVLGTALINRMN